MSGFDGRGGQSFGRAEPESRLECNLAHLILLGGEHWEKNSHEFGSSPTLGFDKVGTLILVRLLSAVEATHVAEYSLEDFECSCHVWKGAVHG